MPNSPTTIAHILDSFPDLNLSVKKMFGEAALYLDGVVVAFICDDTLFLKPTPAALTLLPDTERGPAYPGSKDYIIGSELLDDPGLCALAFRAIQSDAPAPKPKRPKPPKA
jgi:TfoX/Sxy family transcriptional regulator of competence genes